VHPVAGKCKHCKADLTSHQPTRPAASAPLPALLSTTSRGGRGDAPPGAAASSPLPAARGAGATATEARAPRQPRPAADPGARTGSAWRSWPAVVISAAIVAIVAALVLMVWPAAQSELQVDHKSRLPPPPAPERMQTEPDIKQPAPATRQLDPGPPAAPADPPPPARDPDADAPGPGVDRPAHAGDPAPGSGTSQAVPPEPTVQDPSASPIALAMVGHLCRRMVQCGQGDDTAQHMCDSLLGAAPLPRCTAARRCLLRIDQMSCAARQRTLLRQPSVLITQFPECAAAIRC